MDSGSFQRLLDVYRERGPLLDKINLTSPWHVLHRQITTENLLHLVPSGKVLDLAAGTGQISREMAERGCDVTMVEISPDMCTIASNAVPQSCAGRVRVVCDDACTWRDSSEGAFDAVICTQALNFFDEPGALFRTAAWSLRPGGVLYFDIDTAYRWAVIEALIGRSEDARAILELGVDSGRSVVGADYFFYAQTQLEAMLLEQEFRVESVTGILYAAPFLHLFNRSAQFLEPDSVHPAAGRFLDRAALDELLSLERAFTRHYAPDTAGYQVFIARKESVV